jgi:hypothetical protein
MITLFDILIAAALLGFAYWGWLVGLQAASVAALEVAGCLAIAVVLHESVAGFMHSVGSTLYGDSVSQALCVLIAFGGLAWGTFAALRLLLHKASSEDDESGIEPLTDRLGGAVAGLVGGTAFVGGVLVTLSMAPFLSGLKPSGDRLILDVGKLVLQTVGQFVLERDEGRPLPLWGEPPSKISVGSARLTSEPWVDCDDDGACTDADRYRDVDGDGIFTKDLYFLDVDGDGMRRIGLIDKYVAGCWDASLRSDDRPRPDVKKTASPAPVVVVPSSQPAVKPQAAPEPKPGDAKPDPAKPDPAKPDPAKPDPAKPDPAKPGQIKPGPREPSKSKPPEEKSPDDDF